MIEITFAMIKPDAVQAKNTGKIIDMIETKNFEVLGMQKGILTKELAEKFYEIHKDRPFFGELVEFISSGPVIIMAIAKENAIKEWRDIMGSTDPKEAAEGTVRKLFGTNIGINAVHGSDAPETAAQELSLFFPELAKAVQERQQQEKN